mmetsp:Transcript_29302/g.93923  ORF Transcript_29302/g.93923 Transcript_29302/m.93923 type:complete len:267 (-) Transcript_29302:1736-2536(-)
MWLPAPYYIANFALLASYVPWRLSLPAAALTGQAMWLEGVLTREMEVYCVVVVLILTRVRRSASWEEVLRRAITIAKFAELALLYMMDRRVFGAYLVLMALLFLMPAPRRDDDPNVKPLTELEFASQVRKATGDDAATPTWLVCFTADWCEDANLFRPIFSRLAAKYGGAPRAGRRFAFGLVDVVYSREVAREFQINDTYMTRQLPTVILFHRGREIRRLPAFKSDGSVVGGRIAYEDAVSYFELDSSKPSFMRRQKGAKRTKKDA